MASLEKMADLHKKHILHGVRPQRLEAVSLSLTF